VIAAPPDVAAVQLTVMVVAVATAVGRPAWPGTVDGVTAPEGVDDAPVPTALRAVTVKVYKVPFFRPGTVHRTVGTVATQVFRVGAEVTV
jgi:hypothetical protein